MSGIAESDWKVFRKVRASALERMCGQILAETKEIAEQSTSSAHERYLKIYTLIQDRDDEIARAFNDLRRSTAIMQIGIMHGMGLFTKEELFEFSDEVLNRIDVIAPVPWDEDDEEEEEETDDNEGTNGDKGPPN